MGQRIFYIHQYFKTPQEGGAIRSYYLAKGLVESGFDVEMITSHNESMVKVQEIDGITVHYLPVNYSNEMGALKRILAFLKYVRLAKRYINKLEKPDLAYVSSTPLTVGLIGLWMKRKLKIPFVFEVRDLWPTAPIEMGVIKNLFLKKYLYRLESKIYHEAEKIVALSPGMRDWIKKVAPQKDVSMIPNMADCQFFKKELKDPKLIDFYHAKEPLVITYLGSVGATNHLEYLLEIAELSQKQGLNISFKVVGKGSQLRNIKLNAFLKRLSNIEFIGYQNKEGVRRILNVTDATYVSFANVPVLGTNSPNKLFDSLASGKLTIVNSTGWTKQLVEQYKCGFYTNPELPQDFIEKISPFLQDRNMLETYKNNARSIAERLYSRKLQVEKLVKVLNNEVQIKAEDNEVYILTA